MYALFKCPTMDPYILSRQHIHNSFNLRRVRCLAMSDPKNTGQYAWITNALSQVKEARHKSLHIVCFHLLDMQEKAKPVG